jgi:hypothetical protein
MGRLLVAVEEAVEVEVMVLVPVLGVALHMPEALHILLRQALM